LNSTNNEIEPTPNTNTNQLPSVPLTVQNYETQLPNVDNFDIENSEFEELDPEEQAKLDKEVEEFRLRLELCSKYTPKVVIKPVTPHGEIKQI